MMIKKIMLLLLLLNLSACLWRDHFDMSDRLDDEHLEALESKETKKSQYNYLYDNNLFGPSDFQSDAFFELTAEQRIAIFLKLHPNIDDTDKELISNKLYYPDVGTLWILAIYGPPPRRSEAVAGFETWYYPGDKMFEFHRGLLVSAKDR